MVPDSGAQLVDALLVTPLPRKFRVYRQMCYFQKRGLIPDFALKNPPFESLLRVPKTIGLYLLN